MFLMKNSHTAEVKDLCVELQSNPTDGLTSEEAETRLTTIGRNTLIEERKESFWKEFFEELREPMVLMLLVTGVLYALWGEVSDAITIFIIILTLNTVEVVNEQRSKKAIASLRKLAEPTATVRRDGHFQEVPVEQVVPGDLILLQAGHRVPADARLVECFGLAVDESALTGEPVPVEKKSDTLQNTALPLAERHNMVYSSTLVVRGKGTALVVATGMQSEIGRVAGLARQVKEPRTPLQGMMEELSKVLVWFALGFSVLVPLVGIFLAHQPPQQMLLTGLSLAFATIPEELPIIITMVLSLGAFRLSKSHAIARRLNSVESLGSVTVIATDKTGTLTENRMEVVCYEPMEAKDDLLKLAMFCNDATPDGDDFHGDAVDTGLLRAAQKQGWNIQEERKTIQVLAEFPFDNTRKRMATIYLKEGQYWVAVKGAPEAVLARCTLMVQGEAVIPLTEPVKQVVLEKVSQMAANGLRVLAFARSNLPASGATQETAESDLTLVGLIGLQDPPRPEVREAIATCQRAGIRTIMITGDHPLTARSIGLQTGLQEVDAIMSGAELDMLSDEELKEAVRHTSIYARATPEHKLRIVQALQALGERVAVTGDGVNDAPALAAADIGVAMGEGGTDVAREAADMILTNDNFTTIVSAVKEGRLIFENLKKGVRYYLACKLALILINLLPTLLLVPVPFAPVQIILMELFMDLMAAAAFVIEKPESDLLDQQPRNPQAKFMDKSMMSSIVRSSLGLFAAVSVGYLVTWYGTKDATASQTVAFFSWLIGHVLLAFNMRSERQPLFQLGLGSNSMMLIWGLGVAAFLLVCAFVPAVQQLMKITPLTGKQWLMILGTAFLGTFWLEVGKALTFRK